jgi:hypothetical protein
LQQVVNTRQAFAVKLPSLLGFPQTPPPPMCTENRAFVGSAAENGSKRVGNEGEAGGLVHKAIGQICNIVILANNADVVPISPFAVRKFDDRERTMDTKHQ